MPPDSEPPRPLRRAVARGAGRRRVGLAWLALAWGLAAAPAPAQHAAPGGESGTVRELLDAGGTALDREDPVAAWTAYRAVRARVADLAEGLVGLGQAHLLLGRAHTARAYAEVVLAAAPDRQDAMSLLVRAQIRGRQFDVAARAADGFVTAAGQPTADLLAALGSALFRVQRIDDAATAYRRVIELDDEYAEAHLRLGSGLSAPREVTITAAVHDVVSRMRSGDLDAAIAALHALLVDDPGNAVLHRLLGEALFQRRADRSMAGNDRSFRRLAKNLPRPRLDPAVVAQFVPAYPALSPERQAVVDRALGLFASRLGKLLTIGARHDLLLEVERTTDAAGRATLRGKRTFDGRVWDDVRGIGGLHAATGIEALDEAAQFGFDTLVHEIAHQVHYYAIPHRDRVQIRGLYKAAVAQGRCLDYYAATNEAEYFGQGVEAFASLGKRPGGETTHGHTRFELLRTDPALHDLIASLVDGDPLGGPERRQLLLAAYDVAMRCGRPEDAVTAAEMLEAGPERLLRLMRARAAVRDASSH